MQEMIPAAAAAQPVSIAYNGAQMSKQQLMAYLYEITKYKKQFAEFERRRAERENQLESLQTAIRGRRRFAPEYKSPPSGLERFSSRKMREYQEWLNDAPRREEALRRRQKEEDDRIAELQRKYDELANEQLDGSAQMCAVADKYKELMLRQVIAPDYRDGDIPQTLLLYLFNGRANTLAEAVNLYHEEDHRQKMLAIAQQQQQEARLAHKRQLDLMWSQVEAQREQARELAKLAQAAEETKKSVKNIEFLTWLDFISD